MALGQSGCGNRHDHDARDRLVTVKEDFNLAEVKALLHRHRIEKILVVNDGFELKGLITLKDILKSEGAQCL